MVSLTFQKKYSINVVLYYLTLSPSVNHETHLQIYGQTVTRGQTFFIFTKK